MNNNNKGSSVLITVGSTQFTELMKVVDTEAFLKLIQKLGFNKVIIQYGEKEVNPPVYLSTRFTNGETNGVEIITFASSHEYDKIMKGVDLMISHAGSGTIFGGIRANKKMIVVVNKKLMDNHQDELADTLCKNNFILTTGVDALLQALDQQYPTFIFQTHNFPASNTQVWASNLDQIMNLS